VRVGLERIVITQDGQRFEQFAIEEIALHPPRPARG